jgi:hypothetical protein
VTSNTRDRFPPHGSVTVTSNSNRPIASPSTCVRRLLLPITWLNGASLLADGVYWKSQPLPPNARMVSFHGVPCDMVYDV